MPYSYPAVVDPVSSSNCVLHRRQTPLRSYCPVRGRSYSSPTSIWAFRGLTCETSMQPVAPQRAGTLLECAGCASVASTSGGLWRLTTLCNLQFNGLMGLGSAYT